MFDDFFARKQMGKLIAKATQRLSSDDFDIDATIRELMHSKEDVELMRAYIAVQAAAKVLGQATAPDVEAAYHSFRASAQHLDDPGFAEILDIHRELAEIFANRKRAQVLALTGMMEDESEMDRRVCALQRRLDSLVRGL